VKLVDVAGWGTEVGGLWELEEFKKREFTHDVQINKYLSDPLFEGFVVTVPSCSVHLHPQSPHTQQLT